MPDWIITEEEQLMSVDDVPSYFYIADDREHKHRGELFKLNPPHLGNERSNKWRENLTFYRKLVGRFPCGSLHSAKQIREYLEITKGKCQHVMRYLCSFGYANRYIKGVMWEELDSHHRRPYGVHYMLLRKELPKQYYE